MFTAKVVMQLSFVKDIKSTVTYVLSAIEECMEGGFEIFERVPEQCYGVSCRIGKWKFPFTSNPASRIFRISMQPNSKKILKFIFTRKISLKDIWEWPTFCLTRKRKFFLLRRNILRKSRRKSLYVYKLIVCIINFPVPHIPVGSIKQITEEHFYDFAIIPSENF